MIACPRCGTYVGSIDEFHVCVTPLRAEFTRLEEQVAYLTEMLTAVHEKVVGALPPRAMQPGDDPAPMQMDDKGRLSFKPVAIRPADPRKAQSSALLDAVKSLNKS